jgi:hypothetical protein
MMLMAWRTYRGPPLVDPLDIQPASQTDVGQPGTYRWGSVSDSHNRPIMGNQSDQLGDPIDCFVNSLHLFDSKRLAIGNPCQTRARTGVNAEGENLYGILCGGEVQCPLDSHRDIRIVTGNPLSEVAGCNFLFASEPDRAFRGGVESWLESE